MPVVATPVEERKQPADRATARLPEHAFDAIVVVSFGGPEGMDDVMPFLENVTRGRGVPRERLLDVAHHYELFGGVSPINAQNRELIAALEPELRAHGVDLPVYFGNRNWQPFLTDTMRQMRDDGVRRALAVFTSAFSSYSGCRQYREDLFNAQQAVGPMHPRCRGCACSSTIPVSCEANVERVRAALASCRGRGAHRVHSPLDPGRDGEELRVRGAAGRGGAARRRRRRRSGLGRRLPEPQRAAAGAVARAGRLRSPRDVAARGVRNVVVSPLGFVSDHLEVLYDLDVEARATADSLGLAMARAGCGRDASGVRRRAARLDRRAL